MVTVIVTVSAGDSRPRASVTLKENTNTASLVSPVGAVNDGRPSSVGVKLTLGPLVCVHA